MPVVLNPHGAKRARTLRACNECRTKKVKCEDGDGEQCQRCLEHRIPCTGKLPLPRPQVKKSLDSADALEQQLNQVQSALSKAGTLDSPSPREGPEEEEGNVDDVIHARTDTVSMGVTSLLDSVGHHFFGQSSGLVFLNKALDIKRSMARNGMNEDPMISTLVQPWLSLYEPMEEEEEPMPAFSFPEPDLLFALIDIYFTRLNVYFPLLHQPSFNAGVSSGLHLKSRQFAEVVLLVAAAAARFSTDDRVLISEAQDGRFSSGWQWFSQVQLLPKTLVRVSGLHELQKICLASCYLHGTSSPQVIWSLVGVGLRLAQERGIHRRKRPGHLWTAEDELWKRAFWILICVDRLSCSVLGRPCSLHDEDFDVELPVVCDDEYWENADPKLAFKQPEGKPSHIVFFVTMIRLTDILAFTLRTVYAVGKYKTFMSKSNPRWQEDIIHSIDSALNKWHDTIPKFLQWPNSNPPETLFYHQSAALHLTYHYLQIQAHRPFIPSIHGHSKLSHPSLVISANAARSCSHILSSLGTDPSWIAIPFCGPIAFTSGVFLLLHIWEAEKYGFSIDSTRELQDARRCLTYLNSLKDRLYVTRNFAILLEHLVAQEAPPTRQVVNQPPPSQDDMVTDVPYSDSRQTPPNDAQQPFNMFQLPGAEYLDSWEINDITILRNLGTADSFYREMFTSFSAPADAEPLEAPYVPVQNDQPVNQWWLNPGVQMTSTDYHGYY